LDSTLAKKDVSPNSFHYILKEIDGIYWCVCICCRIRDPRQLLDHRHKHKLLHKNLQGRSFKSEEDQKVQFYMWKVLEKKTKDQLLSMSLMPNCSTLIQQICICNAKLWAVSILLLLMWTSLSTWLTCELYMSVNAIQR
jgi:hypothetical protein